MRHAKICLCLFLLALCLTLTGCQRPARRAEIAPRTLTQTERDLLSALALENDAALFTFRAPEGATSLTVFVSQLDDDGQWRETGGGSLSLDAQDAARGAELLSGTLGLLLGDHYAISCHLTTQGRASFTSEPVALTETPLASTYAFLPAAQPIALGETVPIVLLCYDDGNTASGVTLSAYADPTPLAGAALAQVVTVTFE